LKIELTKTGMLCEQQNNIKVYYESEQVGDYYADLLVNGLVIIELKAAEALRRTRDSIINYLKATDIEVGLLLNFGKKAEIKRKIFLNEHKKIKQRKSAQSE